MKLAVRVFSLLIVFAGLATASVSSASLASELPNHLSASASRFGPLNLPVPQCGPGVPTCHIVQ